jgi:hypothetical protein
MGGGPQLQVADVHWNPSPEEPYTCMSVSDDSEEDGTGGGSLQIWRINDLIWRPEKVQCDVNHAHLPSAGVQGWRACPHGQLGCPNRGRGAPSAAAAPSTTLYPLCVHRLHLSHPPGSFASQGSSGSC